MKKKCNFVERKNKSLFNPEKVALAAFPLKSNYIKNKVKLSNDWGVLNCTCLSFSSSSFTNISEFLSLGILGRMGQHW